MQKKRTNLILFAILFLLLFVSQSFGEEQKKYPPYPDVWGVELVGQREGQMFVTKTLDGDYIATYPMEIGKEYCRNKFFSGESKIFNKSEYKIFCSQYKPIDKRKIILGTGNTIEQYLSYNECPHPYDDLYIIQKDKQGRILSKKMLFYLYDEPRKTDMGYLYELRKCYVDGDYIFMKVDNVYADLVPLEDGGFLVYNAGHNFIIRFDKNFNTKSQLMNNRLFLIDRTTYMKIREDLKKENKENLQNINDALSEYLVKLQKEVK